jgi:hypothetical protein
VLGAVIVATLAVATPASGAAVLGEQRVLIVRATWGPAVATEQQTRQAFEAGSAFVRRASFGKAGLRGELAKPVEIGRLRCVNSGDEFFESRFAPVRAAAVAAGHDLGAWDRIVYLVPSSRNEPEDTCRGLSVGRGREVFVMGEPSAFTIVHELGHTWGLAHARSADCRRCRRSEYGDSFSVMGHGFDDFSAYEKSYLGWGPNVRTVRRSGTFTIATPARASSRPQALVVPAAHGQYWIEHRRGDLLVRLILSSALDSEYDRPTLLLGWPDTRNRYCERRVLSAQILPGSGATRRIRVDLRPRRC